MMHVRVGVSSVQAVTAAKAPPAPRNGLIAYIQNGDIWTIKPTGAGKKQLTRTGNNNDAVFSPHGKLIAFDSTRSGNEDVYVMNANGTGVRQVTTKPSYEAEPSWSPDGTQLAFISDRNGIANVFRIKATVPYGAAVQLTSAGGDPDPGNIEGCDQDVYQYPRWNPVANVVMATLVCDYFTNAGDFILQSVDGTTGVMLNTTLGLGYISNWAPKGTKLVYVNAGDDDIDGNFWLTRVNVDGTDRFDITPEYYGSAAPRTSSTPGARSGRPTARPSRTAVTRAPRRTACGSPSPTGPISVS